ncbi:MAG: hypothetical protein ACQETH_08180 [Candidatus Rifleibacteriota bacterium]
MIFRKQKNRMGSAIITAIGMAIVLMLVIAGLQIFTSHRIQTTIQTSRKAKALSIAEAGIAATLAELSYNYSFQTHKVSKKLKWQEKVDNKQVLSSLSSHNFSIDSNSEGTYSGSIGDGTFKVRVGRIPFEDDEDTLNIDESHSYLLIESLGRFEDSVKKVMVVVNRRFPAREFLMYDGGFLSLVYGQPGKNNKNVFSTGHLYGHRGVEISQILMSGHNPVSPGTTQELADMNAIISGAGGIFFFSPIRARFRDKPGLPGPDMVLPANSHFPTNGQYSSAHAEKYGEYPEEMRESIPKFSEELQEKLSDWIKDKHAGVSIPLDSVPFDYYKSEAQKPGRGLFFAKTFSDSNYQRNYKVPNGWTGTGNDKLKSVLLDFGDNIRPGNVSVPSNFNGMIYAETDVIIKGNPPEDLHIVTPENVFVAGDFNQAGNPDIIEERYGLPQDYESGKNALTSSDYRSEVKAKLIDDIDSSDFRNHVAATVVAGKRVVYDYRSPVDCFENELYPFMKYKLAASITDETEAEQNTLQHNISGIIETTATTEEDFKAGIEDFFSRYKIDGSVEDDLTEKFTELYNDKDGKFDFNDFDEISKKIWTEYAQKYDPEEDGELSDEAKNIDFGVYKLLKDLRQKMNIPGDGDAENFNPDVVDDSPGDFLYFPEMTTNAMFISCAKRNNVFYAGPDYTKIYNEIGRSSLCESSGVGLEHSKMQHMVHRIYGSEIKLRINKDVQPLGTGFYRPPTRRKLYDETLPRMGLNNSSYELASYLVLTWQDTVVSTEFYQNF